jgi:hypothetical protein
VPTETPTGGGGEATATPTATVEAAVNIKIGSASGNIGDTVSIDVSLELPLLGTEVAGTENTITFSGGIGAAISIVAKSDGTPDCTVNEAINKSLSDAFQPPNCSGEECTGYKGIIISLEKIRSRPGLLYTCNVKINDTAADGQTYPRPAEPVPARRRHCAWDVLHRRPITVGGGGTPTATAGSGDTDNTPGTPPLRFRPSPSRNSTTAARSRRRRIARLAGLSCCR